MPAQRVLEYLEGSPDDGPYGGPVTPDPSAIARLELLIRDFDHYANHGDPDQGADQFFRLIHGHLTSLYLLATGQASITSVVDETIRHDKALAEDAILIGATSAVGTHREGSAS
jgi:hypothetical protein